MPVSNSLSGFLAVWKQLPNQFEGSFSELCLDVRYPCVRRETSKQPPSDTRNCEDLQTAKIKTNNAVPWTETWQMSARATVCSSENAEAVIHTFANVWVTSHLKISGWLRKAFLRKWRHAPWKIYFYRSEFKTIFYYFKNSCYSNRNLAYSIWVFRFWTSGKRYFKEYIAF